MPDSPREDHLLHQGSALVERLTGVHVPEYRHPLLHSELERIGAGSGVENAVRRLAEGDVEARNALFSSITIPETYLFRHFGHFELLREVARSRRERGLPTRVLSAGCSTGEEAWSAAAILATVPKPADGDHVVLGWELCGERLKRARAGRFSTWACRSGLKGHNLFFDRAGDEVLAGTRLREITAFQQVNLVHDELPSTGVFDVVLLRNVAIYWSEATTREVVSRLTRLVDEDGLLLIGPSDPVHLPHPEWEHVIRNGVRLYRRHSAPEKGGSPAPTQEVAEQSPPSPRPRVRPLPSKRDRFDTPPPARREVPPPRPAPDPRHAAEAELVEDHIERRLARARQLADAGRYADAVELLDNHEAGASVEGKLWRGILSLSLEHDREAVRLFRQCVFLRPDVAEYHRWLGVSLEAVGRTTEAARAHKNADELDDQ